MRVFILGIDGLTYHVLDPMVEAGWLPNFKRLKTDAAWGTLRSTIPPYTPPAWMSIATGLKPAGHGVFDFWDLRWPSGRIEAKLVTRRKAGRAMWEILSEYEKRVVVVNVPCTYPPDPVNGIMISGFSAPSLDSAFVYPADFRAELLNRFPDYQIDVQGIKDFGVGNEDYKLETVHRITDVRINLLDHLLDSADWDFMFFTFVGPDRLQHVLWKEITEASHPRIIQYYQKLDHALGQVRKSLGPSDWLFLVSDHGFQGAEQFIDLNILLAELGLAKPRLKSYLASIVARIAQPLGVKDFLRKRFMPSLQKEWFASIGANVDLDASQCIAVNGDGFGLVYSQGAVEESALQSIADRLVQRDVARQADILWGGALENEMGRGEFSQWAPRLAVLPRSGLSFRSGIRLDGSGRRFPMRGVHAMDGVVMIAGPGAKPGRTDGATVYDVAPSVLHAFGLPRESQFEGKVFDCMAPAVSGSTLVRDERTGAVWDAAQSSQTALAERLRTLTDSSA